MTVSDPQMNKFLGIFKQIVNLYSLDEFFR